MIETTRYSPMKIHVDATVRPHEGGAGAVAAVYQNHNGRTVGKMASQIGNNYKSTFAEYEAILRALHHVAHVPQVRHVNCYTDCEPVVDAFENDESHRLKAMRKYRAQINRVASNFDVCNVEWIPREQNGHADGMADMAHDLLTGSYADFDR